MTTPHDIALLRLAAPRIAGPGFATATDAVRWLTAVQAQDYRGAVTSVALRTESQTRQSVEAALNAHEIVRSWPMRATLHFVLAEDLAWMLDHTTERPRHTIHLLLKHGSTVVRQPSIGGFRIVRDVLLKWRR